MTQKISAEDLLRKMYAPGAKVEDFAAYFKVEPDPAGAFHLKVTYDPALVDMGDTPEAMQRAALALPGFNGLVRLLRRGQFELKLLGGYDGPILVAEGDSWFAYPQRDVVGALNDTYAISHLAAAGDTLAQMLAQDEYLNEVHRVGARVLLLSGGGNDALGGGDLKTHLRPFDPALTPAQHVRASYTGLVDDAIRRFDRIFRRIAREAPGVTAICHGYDYAIPVKGKWLGKPMKQLGIVDPDLQRAIVRDLIDRFSLAMSRLAQRYPHVVFLNNRGTLSDKEWADELHPNPAGFTRIAAKFDAAIQKAATRSRSGAAVAAPGRGRSPSPTRAGSQRGQIEPTGLNKGYALHIGLNKVDADHYNGPQTLYGCHNDARAMERIAEAAGYADRKILLDGEATAKAVTAAIARAAEELQAGDIFLLTYAGHGASVPDFSGDERDDGRDETWCLYDRQLLDDELYEGWRAFREGVRLLVISDSCHSGSVIRNTAPGLVSIDAAADPDIRPRPRCLPDHVRRDVNARHQALYREVSRALNPQSGQFDGIGGSQRREVDRPLPCTVRLISGCQDNQTSGDGDINGLFTSRLLQVLEEGFRGDYEKFHRAILHLMPETQTPNHWVVGRKDPGFDSQNPFEI